MDRMLPHVLSHVVMCCVNKTCGVCGDGTRKHATEYHAACADEAGPDSIRWWTGTRQDTASYFIFLVSYIFFFNFNFAFICPDGLKQQFGQREPYRYCMGSHCVAHCSCSVPGSCPLPETVWRERAESFGDRGNQTWFWLLSNERMVSSVKQPDDPWLREAGLAAPSSPPCHLSRQLSYS